MSKFESPLNNISIASPCSADWNEMYGDDRKRFCGECKLNVYNLSGMSRDEAESLMMNSEGRLCVRFYKRADGSVITQDCPIGWAKVKQRTKIFATALASLIMALFTGILFVSAFSKGRTIMGEIARPLVIPSPTPIPLMGAIAAPPKNANAEIKGDVVQGKVAAPQKKQSNEKFEMGKMKVISSESIVSKNS
ncbi:MAG: hypothetical protein IPL32_05460 [Chloracidobacterium sp.]|nr:hypothetical protein [Chloracidobacterium sp.]